ncbi:MAG TPA: hypothetical protein VI566_13690 [Xanthomonadales bacterium]|nr:hypothetical protein [Xanthomonadales bacterium]
MTNTAVGVDTGAGIGRTRLGSPIILGSFDALIDAELMDRCFELCGGALGAIVTKSTTIDPRQGYAEPKVSPFGQGFLVASGNTNPGISRMASEVRRLKAQRPGAVVFGSIVSDAAHPERNLDDQYSFLAREYAQAGVHGVELNLSCPHLDPDEKEHTIVPAQESALVARLVGAVKSSLAEAGCMDCLVIPKLTGWNCDPVEVALAAEHAGADAVTISNLFPGTGYYTGLAAAGVEHSSGRKLGQHLLAHGKGAFSGKAMHSAVLLMIENLRKHIQIPILGTGGCAADLDSLVQAFMAGATAVQSVTPFYFSKLQDMGSLHQVKRLVQQLQEFLELHGLQHPQDLYELRLGAGRG